jgi:hypothetical protein
MTSAMAFPHLTGGKQRKAVSTAASKSTARRTDIADPKACPIWRTQREARTATRPHFGCLDLLLPQLDRTNGTSRYPRFVNAHGQRLMSDACLIAGASIQLGAAGLSLVVVTGGRGARMRVQERRVRSV